MFRSQTGDDSPSTGEGPDSRSEEKISQPSNPKIVVIGGPTASGKNQLAFELAAHFPSEIVNADSRQIYRGLTIGTNQPSEKDKQKVPHHLFGVLHPERFFSVAEYVNSASRIAVEILNRGNLPVIVGGTGFYIRGLLRGVWPVPKRDYQLRERVKNIIEHRGKAFIHKMLGRIDPLSAQRIPVNDTYRVIRALEIYLQSGIRRSELDQNGPEKWNAAKFYLDPERGQLRENIQMRVEKMFKRGWVEEVEALLEPYPDLASLAAGLSIGYREIIDYLRGDISLDECKKIIIRKTNQYAKQQLTWFRNQDSFVKLAGAQELYKIIDVIQLMRFSSGWSNLED